MNKKIRIIVLLPCIVFFTCSLHAQNVGVGVATPLQKLHVAGNTSTLRLEGISSASAGTFILNTTAITDKLVFVNNSGDLNALPNGAAGEVLTITASGYPDWLASSSSNSWLLTGNAGTVAGTNFIGTTDAVDLILRTSNADRLRIASGGNVGINATPSATERLLITDAAQTTALRVNTTNAAAGSKALHANGVTGTNAYLGYVGAITLNLTTVTNAGVYSTVTSGTSGAIVGATTGGTGSGVYGYSSVSSGGRFTNNIASVSALIADNQAANAPGSVGHGIFATTIQQNGFCIDAVHGNANGTAVFGIGGGGTGFYSGGGSGGVFVGYDDGALCESSDPTYGQAIRGMGNGLIGATVWTAGSGGVFNGTDLGGLGYATGTGSIGLAGGSGDATGGTGTIGLGNAINTAIVLVNGSGGAFEGTNVGSYGIATAGNGWGVYGSASNFTNGTGVVGGGNGITPATLSSGSGGLFAGTLVGSYSSASLSGGIGVYGLGKDAANGIGVLGLGNNIVTPTVPLTGAGGAFTGAGYGSYNVATTGTGSYNFSKAILGTGVVGYGNNSLLSAIPGGGQGGAFFGTTSGAYGQANNSTNGIGVTGLGNNLTATSIQGSKGAGGAFAGTNFGVWGYASTVATGVGIFGVSGVNPIITYTYPGTGAGVVGNGDEYGMAGYSSSNIVSAAGTYGRAGGYFQSGTGGTQSWSYVGAYDNIAEKIVGNGSVSTVIKDDENKYRMLFAPEAPENLFMDYGTGVLVNGKIHVDIDELFSKSILVNEKHPLRVFIQLEGDCNGVYVTNKSPSGFDVVELQGGTSNVSFSYTVVGNRRNETYGDYAEQRFTQHPGPLPSTSGGEAEAAIPSTQSNESTTKTIELVELPGRAQVQTKAQMKKDDKQMIMVPKNTETQTRPK